MAGYGPNPPDRVRGRARQLCPSTSDVDFLGDLKRVVDLNAEVAHGAFDARVAEQQLDHSQVPRTAIDEGRLRPAHRMRGELPWVKTDAGNPSLHQARVLPRRQGSIWAAS